MSINSYVRKGINPSLLLASLLCVNSGAECLPLKLGEATDLGEGKLWIQTGCTLLKNWLCVASWS